MVNTNRMVLTHVSRQDQVNHEIQPRVCKCYDNMDISL